MGAVAGWYISPESFQKGYDPGIDDYMVKPGDFSGLLMRVRALLRRANIEASRKLSVDGLLLYADALTASLAGAEIPVTIREFNILYELLSCPNRTFPRGSPFFAFHQSGHRRPRWAAEKFLGKGTHFNKTQTIVCYGRIVHFRRGLSEGVQMGRHPLKQGIDFLRSGSGQIRRAYNASASRTLHLAGISGAGNLLLGLGKIASGILSLSVFVCVNGLYTLGMVLARYCALAGAVRTQDAKKQYGYYRRAGRILIAASLLYMLLFRVELLSSQSGLLSHVCGAGHRHLHLY